MSHSCRLTIMSGSLQQYQAMPGTIASIPCSVGSLHFPVCACACVCVLQQHRGFTGFAVAGRDGTGGGREREGEKKRPLFTLLGSAPELQSGKRNKRDLNSFRLQN